ncbi:MAG: hypothetical protein AAFV80_17305 [Bacteroidota bacterium]
MGQDIKYILIEAEHEVPKNIVHFNYEKGIVLPIDFYDSDYENIMETPLRFPNSEALFTFIKAELICEDSVLELIDWLHIKRITTFMLSGYREIMDIPQGLFQLIFLEDHPVNASDPVLEELPLSDLLPLTDLTRTNEQLFFSYDDAFYAYFKDDPDRELVRRYE